MAGGRTLVFTLLTVLISILSSAQFLRAQAPREPAEVLPPAPQQGGEVGAPAHTRDVESARETSIIPEGTVLEVRLTHSLDSDVNVTGDSFEAVLDRGIEIGGRLVFERRTGLIGVVSEVADAGRVKGRARMSLKLKKIVLKDGRSLPIRSSRIEFQAKGSVARDAKKVGIGAGIGALIGAIAGGGDGAAIGAAIGGGAATASVLLTEGDHVKLDVERLLSFRLERDLRFER